MKIGNINRKLIAGLLAVTFMTAGCTGETYVAPTETTAKVESVSSFYQFDNIKNWKIVVFDVNGENVFYIANKVSALGKYNFSTTYRDVFDKKHLKTIIIPSLVASNIISEGDLLSYLVIYDKIQSSYTEEELKEILEQIKADFEMQEEKIKSLEN